MEYSNLFFSGYVAVCEKASHALEQGKPSQVHGARSIPRSLGQRSSASLSSKADRRRSLPPPPRLPSELPPPPMPEPSSSKAAAIRHTAELLSGSSGSPSVTLSVCDADEDAEAFLDILSERFSIEPFRQQTFDTAIPESPRSPDTLHPSVPTSRANKRHSLPTYMIPAHPPPPPPKIQIALSTGRKGKNRADLSPIAESPTVDRPVDWPHDPVENWRKAIDDIFGDDVIPDTSPVRPHVRRRNLSVF